MFSPKPEVLRLQHNLLPQDFDTNPTFSVKNSVSFGVFLDVVPKEHEAFCGWLDIIGKYDSKDDFMNFKCPEISFFVQTNDK